MLKRVGSLLFVGIVGYTLGTMSSIYADSKAPNKQSNKEVIAKLDKVLKGQEEIQTKLKQIWFKVK